MARSIPACAGEPYKDSPLCTAYTVYPRVCGGTYSAKRRGVLEDGLSPRVRGNPGDKWSGSMGVGSIPACAGEPSSVGRLSLTMTVYPRVCGGTRRALQDHPPSAGLSPRVRGNLYLTVGRPQLGGLSPRVRGNLSMTVRLLTFNGSIPRVCGGTPYFLLPPSKPEGLSPRVRGNRCGRRYTGRSDGSIPACAGEPR